ncbi:uncharacterized protein N7482_000681 [Penicillium canariense]|uniref:Zn(2)-C6 fungal-type domain-containing protein n=1 Tax=Penicillium canariense TaxID=189055 RepID=A0A9W9IC24_9EURO|nr:uncharacterized protein N7482_000681 [Penicillium canariense]KAJ5174804.1 hypothetical protein N7482_000681 [Penicillium canariense]
MSTPERSSPGPSRAPRHSSAKSQRILACVLCQQRKVKCDRRFPCANCVKHQTQCVPVAQTRPRRRRFPERQLLDRLRMYEDLLRQNKIKFEPLHKESGLVARIPGLHEENEDSDAEQPESEGTDGPFPSDPSKPKSAYEAKNIWYAMSHGFRGVNNDGDLDDGVREVMVGKTWDQVFDNDDHLLFGSRQAAVNVSTLHPEPVHIFRLWQIYLDNVNHLLKVTHTPSLQGRIIEAASNLASISPTLEALMFGIYCTAVLSLVDDCQAIFGMPKVDLLKKYQFACQQALLNCGFLRSADRDCLTALYLYLISVQPSTDPRSLSSLLGVAIRIAQRMGIQNESSNSKYPVLECEMRRRLWWSLALFDARISELSDYRTTTLAPTWDCKAPLNVNDFDLRAEMKEPPAVQGKVTEVLFVILRSEIGEFVRHSPFHLDFTNPSLKSVVRDLPGDGDLDALEKIIEEGYLKHCDPQNPLHFMTIWMMRSALSKYRLLEYYSRYCSEPQAERQSDTPMLYAFRVLESDTKIMTSSMTKGYIWFLHLYFPLPAYIHIVQELIKQPVRAEARQAWEIMSDNYEARFTTSNFVGTSIFRTFAKIILQAWEALEEASKNAGDPAQEPFDPPRIVLNLKRRIVEITQKEQNANPEQQPSDVMNTDMTNLLMSIPMGFGNAESLNGMGGPDSYLGIDPMPYPNFPGQVSSMAEMNHMTWASMVWGFRERRGW